MTTTRPWRCWWMVVVTVALSTWSPAASSAQSNRNRQATIALITGETVTGVIQTATADRISLDVGGRLVEIPMREVRYMSFVGPLADRAAGPPSLPSVERARASLETLRTKTEVPMLRATYADALQATLPDVLTFTREADGQWADVKLAMARAADLYRSPLASTTAWARASETIATAASWARYATRLLGQPGEISHVERDRPQLMPATRQAFGRLGLGDARLPSAVDAGAAGSFADRIELDVPAGAFVDLSMICDPCTPRLALTDATGRRIEIAVAQRGQAHLQRRGLAPGRYTIWASGSSAGEVGQYKLTLAVMGPG